MTISFDKQGKQAVKTTRAIENLLLSANDLAQVRAMAPAPHEAPTEPAASVTA